MLVSATKSICFSPSSHPHLLLEHAAATFPGPAAHWAHSVPFDPAAVLQNHHSGDYAGTVVLMAHEVSSGWPQRHHEHSAAAAAQTLGASSPPLKARMLPVSRGRGDQVTA